MVIALGVGNGGISSRAWIHSAVLRAPHLSSVSAFVSCLLREYRHHDCKAVWRTRQPSSGRSVCPGSIDSRPYLPMLAFKSQTVSQFSVFAMHKEQKLFVFLSNQIKTFQETTYRGDSR